MKKIIIFVVCFCLGACASAPVASTPSAEPTQMLPPTETLMGASLLPTETSMPTATDIPKPTSTEAIESSVFADVISVEVSGSENAYQLAVEIRSPDTGCEQYANWWEVVTEDGELIYRRILGHSHVTEQPFTRTGGPVAISADTVVIVRAHMFPGGYGGMAFRGSVNGGFEEIMLDVDFASDLEQINPLPDGCAF